MERFYRIAGIIVKMDTYGRTLEQAEPYMCENTDQWDIHVVANKAPYLARYPMVADDMAEYMCTGGNFYKQLLKHGGLMLHSSAVVVDGRCYLFAADSGTGKSTHTKLWLEKFEDRAFILNDDKPALRLEEDGWFAYGTPWSGKHDISADARVPVAGIACIERAEENSIEPFRGIMAIHGILKQCNRPKEADLREKLLELLDRLITDVPVWKLKCNMEAEAATLAYDVMSGLRSASEEKS